MLQGKIAVITGASRGIGKAIAERFASAGAFVIINYNGSKEDAQEVKREILEHPEYSNEAIAESCGFSRSHLQVKFKEATGLTINEWRANNAKGGPITPKNKS